IRLILERKTGVLIQTPTEQLSEIVAEHLDARRYPSATDLLDRLRSSDSVCESLTERLVGGETGFLRCPAAFDYLAKVVIPELQHISRELVQTYFAKVGQHLLVKPRLRNLVTFTPMNLAAPTYIGRFDCIFCMDVLPHFSTAQRIALVQRLHLYLEPGGYLFLGVGVMITAMGETLNDINNA